MRKQNTHLSTRDLFLLILGSVSAFHAVHSHTLVQQSNSHRERAGSEGNEGAPLSPLSQANLSASHEREEKVLLDQVSSDIQSSHIRFRGSAMVIMWDF